MKFFIFILIAFILMVWVPVESAWRNFCFNNYDLGIYAQAIELLSLDNPNPWLSTRDVFLFNDHFDPVLFLLLPFKGLTLPGVLAIRFEMICLIAAAASPAWLWSRGMISLSLAVMSSVTILWSPIVLDAAFYPAHPGTWSLAPLAWMLAFVFAKKYRWSFVMFGLTLLCKEEYPFVGMAVGLGLIMMGERPYGFVFMASALIWAMLVFAVRPALLGPSSMYTDAVSGFQGLDVLGSLDGALLLLRRLLELATPLTIVLYGAKRWPLRDMIVPGLIVLTLLGIRFAGGYWGNHRVAPLGVGLAYLMIFAVRSEAIKPSKVIIWSLLTVVLAFSSLEIGSRFWRAKPFKKHCPQNPERLSEIQQTLDTLRYDSKGPTLAQGNLIPHAVDLSGISQVGATHGRNFSYLWIEKGADRNTWPLSKEEFQALEDQWRGDPAVTKLFDGRHVILMGRRLPVD
jgi:uncharacterized membrane protein